MSGSGCVQSSSCHPFLGSDRTSQENSILETKDRHIPFELPQSPSLVDESDSSYHRWI